MLDPQLKRGLLDHCVLAALCRGDSYGSQIIKDLSGSPALSRGAPSAPTVWSTTAASGSSTT